MNYLIRSNYMNIQDNVIKEYLKNVYFITGSPCGGKTTISRKLAQKHNFPVYDIDERFPEHRLKSNPLFQPNMNKEFKNADEFFGRSVEEYKKWLIDNTREQLDFVIMDLIRLSQKEIVLCDCHLTMEQADRLTDPSRVVFLIKDPTHVIDDYCNRPDHTDFADYICSTTDVEKAKANCNETLRQLNVGNYQLIKKSKYFWLERTQSSTVEDTVERLEKHFNIK